MREKVFLVVVQPKNKPRYLALDKLEEIKELTRTAGGSVVGSMTVFLDKPFPAYYIGKGKLEELGNEVCRSKANLLIFSIDLSPVQARNIENFCSSRVVDRTGIILDIFARRALTREGKLQVELAQLMYLLPRLTGRGVLLSRLGGGIGTRGPGEKKLEYDRRKIRERIAGLRKDLEKIRTHRDLLRKGRKRKEFNVAVIIGYTNAGKSTLLNSLTAANVLVEDKLFATLDPTTRILASGKGRILFTDTVGFLIDLPHNLIEAFKATLEEINEADVVIHVLDISHHNVMEQYRAVNEVLKGLGIADRPIVIALNKVDKIENQREIARIRNNFPEGVFVSAKNKQGLQKLINEIERRILSKEQSA